MHFSTAIRGMIGVVHLPPMPGDPQARAMGEVQAHALRDAGALQAGGVDGIIVENFGSSPFVRGDAGDPLPPHQVAALALISTAIKAQTGLPVGVNCLRNDARAAMGIATAAELDFIRVNIHTGAYLTDQGVIQGEAAHTLRYRQLLGATRVAILADILVKHAAPLVPLKAADAAHDCLYRGHADGLIVTGAATGSAVDAALLQEVGTAIGKAGLLLIGSGLNPDNAAILAPLADGAIVGTALKRDGQVSAPVDEERVKRLCALCRPLFGAKR